MEASNSTFTETRSLFAMEVNTSRYLMGISLEKLVFFASIARMRGSSCINGVARAINFKHESILRTEPLGVARRT